MKKIPRVGIPAIDGSEASRLDPVRGSAWARGPAEEAARKWPGRSGRTSGISTTQVRGTPRAVPTQGPERAARPRPSLAPGYISPAPAAAAADAEFPEDWPAAESPVADIPASPEVDAATAAAPWRRAAGPAPRGEAEQAPRGAGEPTPEGRSADSPPAAEGLAADSEEESSRDSEQVDYLVALAAAESRARRKGDSERVDQCVALAAGERRRRAAAGLVAGPEGPLEAAGAAGPRVSYAVSLSSDPSKAEVGSIPNPPRSPIPFPATAGA